MGLSWGLFEPKLFHIRHVGILDLTTVNIRIGSPTFFGTYGICLLVIKQRLCCEQGKANGGLTTSSVLEKLMSKIEFLKSYR